MRELGFPDSVFNAVLDKATLDSVLCAEGSLIIAAKCLSEISRVLSSDGVFISISHAGPNSRMSILERPEYGWSVRVEKVSKPMLKLIKESSTENGDDRVYHYIYICKKH
jgi:hypothetical protein